jgi:hypothetical protein
MSPKNRRNATTARPQADINEYHVYDDRIKDVGGVVVTDRGDGGRVVRLSAGQAQYLVDQGAIGLQPKASLSQSAHAMLKQMQR